VVEAALVGQSVDEQVFREAAWLAAKDARPRRQNAYKVELARRTVAQALAVAGGLR
jgi:xanthine dehydrogenase YagS FAD-binding subunit